MSNSFNRLAVYCGSATPADPRYMQLARDVGQTLAKRGIGVVYGGGKAGLMGAVASGALDAGGEVIGVIPQALKDMEVANLDCTELYVVANMHERKQMFTDMSDGFVTLPGGVGTMDELWEAVSWAQLGYHQSPVGLLNSFGYYDGLLAFNREMAETGFIREMHRDILIVGDTLEGLLEKMAEYQPIQTIVQMRAEDL
ncbi:TIGR00730 family Rossman fold protein [Aurantiacibacter sp. MUD11]|uniref:LOG family protein n=1 Tax=Aurantiacibacter sp. MUD11 TaxID=3003265 RepID=UPI0022AAA2C7|nr:TIGR00730 family Rossman fold protein [Aurantiacibacter sp. MUD11]WAT17638.1 TIGR00730 family Rossman fold protein [Aurantiacibacter sp. MUD11]